jgi:nonsense-mediated mRNA decay protein 3
MLVCPRCGKSSEDVEFIEAFCKNCYPANIKCPNRIELKVCKNCDRMFFRGEWVPFDERRISELVIGKCKGEFDSGTFDIKEKIATFVIRKDDAEISITRNIDFVINTVNCQSCSQISGGYYEALVQLRGNESRVKKYRNLFEKRLSKKTFISKEKEQKNGWDLYVGNSKAVLTLVSELGVDAKITTTLAGVRENGKKAYRTTFAIRL